MHDTDKQQRVADSSQESVVRCFMIFSVPQFPVAVRTMRCVGDTGRHSM